MRRSNLAIDRNLGDFLPCSEVQTTSPITPRPARRGTERVMLAGDAERIVEPFTGEGIYLALKEGMATGEELLARLDGGKAALALARIALLGKHRGVTRTPASCAGTGSGVSRRHSSVAHQSDQPRGRTPVGVSPVSATARWHGAQELTRSLLAGVSWPLPPSRGGTRSPAASPDGRSRRPPCRSARGRRG